MSRTQLSSAHAFDLGLIVSEYNIDACLSVLLSLMPLNFASGVSVIDVKARNAFLSKKQRFFLYKGGHFKFILARLFTKFGKTWRRCSGIPTLQNGIGLFLKFVSV